MNSIQSSRSSCHTNDLYYLLLFTEKKKKVKYFTSFFILLHIELVLIVHYVCIVSFLKLDIIIHCDIISIAFPVYILFYIHWK